MYIYWGVKLIDNINKFNYVMKKKDYLEMEKEYKRGTIMLLVILGVIIVGALLVEYYGI